MVHDIRFYDMAKRRAGTFVFIYAVVALGVLIGIQMMKTREADCQIRANIATIDLFVRETDKVKEGVLEFLSDADSTGDLAFHFKKNLTQSFKVRTFDTNAATLHGRSYGLTRFTDVTDETKNDFLLKYYTDQLCGHTPPFSSSTDINSDTEEIDSARLASYNGKTNHFAFATKLQTKNNNRITTMRDLQNVFIGLRKMQVRGPLSKVNDYTMTLYKQVAYSQDMPLDVTVQQWSSGMEGGNNALWRISFRTEQYLIVDEAVALVFKNLGEKFKKLGYEVCTNSECSGLPTALMV